MKPKEKDLLQVRAQGVSGVTQPRSEMPASRPAERKRILIGDREAIEHVESEVVFLKEKSSKEKIPCTGSAQMARAECGAKESITPCKNNKGPCTGSAQIARPECGAKDTITSCKNRKTPCIGNVQIDRAEYCGASDVGNFYSSLIFSSFHTSFCSLFLYVVGKLSLSLLTLINSHLVNGDFFQPP